MTIKVHFDGKAFIPDEPVDVPLGTEATVHVAPADTPSEPVEQSLLDWIAEHPLEDASLPDDLAHQHDHYLYGTPKKED
jgi:hypothetical protein